MKEHELQRLEQRWRARGYVADEVDYLSALVRAERLDGDSLRLAALLGHAPASAACSELGLEVDSALHPRTWAKVLGEYPRPVATRAGLLLGRMALQRWVRPLPGSLVGVCEQVAAWCRDPSEGAGLRAQTLSHAAEHATAELESPDRELARGLARVAALPSSSYLAGDLEQAVTALCEQAPLVGAAPLYERLGAALIPWALGRGDPLLDDPDFLAPPARRGPRFSLDQARGFVRAHQPLADEGAREPEQERAYMAALACLAADPRAADVPLILGTFNGDLNDSLFEAVGDVLEVLAPELRAAALADAMRSGTPEQRAWAASWVGEFPDAALLDPLAALLEDLRDPELRACALDGIAGLALELQLAPAAALLRQQLARETDDGLKIRLQAQLRELD